MSENKGYFQAEEKIRDAYMSLIEEQDLFSIKASDVIRRAGINRSSFYSHYRDMADLMEKTEDAFWDNLMCKMPDPSQAGLENSEEAQINFARQHLSIVIDYFKENGQAIALFAGPQGDPNFLPKVQKKIMDMWYQCDGIKCFKVKPNYALAGIMGMLGALFGQWLHSGFKESPEEFMEIIRQMMENIPPSIIEGAPAITKEYGQYMRQESNEKDSSSKESKIKPIETEAPIDITKQNFKEV